MLFLFSTALAPAGTAAPKIETNRTLSLELIYLGPIHEQTKLRFRGYTKSRDGTMTVRVYVNDPERPFLIRLGEQVADRERTENYRVTKFEYATCDELDPIDGSTRKRETSRLKLFRIDDGEEITLTYNEILIDRRVRVKLQDVHSQKVFLVTKGQKFTVRETDYTVREITEKSIVIRDSMEQPTTLEISK